MSTNNQVAVNAGVELFNKQRVDAAAAQVAVIVRNIKSEQANIAALQADTVKAREAIRKVALDAFTPESIFGGPIPEGPNKETMVKAITDLNACKQANIAEKTRGLTEQIVGNDAGIAGCNERIAEFQQDAKDIVAETTTATEVLGS